MYLYTREMMIIQASYVDLFVKYTEPQYSLMHMSHAILKFKNSLTDRN